MELEVGMYVRTKQGYIAKFKEYDEIFDDLIQADLVEKID